MPQGPTMGYAWIVVLLEVTNAGRPSCGLGMASERVRGVLRFSGERLSRGGAGVSDIDDGPVVFGFVGVLEAGDVVEDLVEVLKVDDRVESGLAEHNPLVVVRLRDAVGGEHDAFAGGEAVLNRLVCGAGDKAHNEVTVFKAPRT